MFNIVLDHLFSWITECTHLYIDSISINSLQHFINNFPSSLVDEGRVELLLTFLDPLQYISHDLNGTEIRTLQWLIQVCEWWICAPWTNLSLSWLDEFWHCQFDHHLHYRLGRKNPQMESNDHLVLASNQQTSFCCYTVLLHLVQKNRNISRL